MLTARMVQGHSASHAFRRSPSPSRPCRHCRQCHPSRLPSSARSSLSPRGCQDISFQTLRALEALRPRAVGRRVCLADSWLESASNRAVAKALSWAQRADQHFTTSLCPFASTTVRRGTHWTFASHSCRRCPDVDIYTGRAKAAARRSRVLRKTSSMCRVVAMSTMCLSVCTVFFFLLRARPLERQVLSSRILFLFCLLWFLASSNISWRGHR
mmetsp:Transcript_34278/g.91567  ORF Transcript_34278/g.91567 Transcript_34278/m.91567 type:complete len:213 (-) Transcript_34278:50-688(-)